MRSREPFGEKLRLRAFNLLVRLELPCPIVEIVQPIQNARLDVAGAGNCSAGCDASSHRTGVDLGRMPLSRDVFCYGAGLGCSALGQGKIFSAPKPVGPHTFNMPM